MKRQSSIIIAVLLAAALPLSAQLIASHATTSAQSSSAMAPLPQPAGKPVARVNGAVLTDRDLLREMYAIFPYARQHNGGVPKAMEEDIRRGAMKMMEFEELVYQEAVRRKMTVSPARTQKAESEFRKQFHSPEQYQALLHDEFRGSRALLRAKICRSLLIEDLLKADVEDKSTISLAEAKTYYDKNPDQFRIPESYAMQTISMIPPQNATPAQLKEARKRAEDVLPQAKATKNYEDFGVLAEKISDDDWRVMMGDHKAVDIDKLPPTVLKAVQGLQPGQVSDLIQVDQSYTIVRLNQHIPAGTQAFVTVKDSLRQQLQRTKTEQLRAALDKKLRKNAKVEEL